MSGLTFPPTPRYIPAPQTKAHLDYADLPIVDLAKFQSTEDRQTLASQIQDALLTHGFFYVVNHGYSQSQTERMSDIADIPFSRVSNEEKETYAGIMKQTGSYQGYKLRQYWVGTPYQASELLYLSDSSSISTLEFETSLSTITVTVITCCMATLTTLLAVNRDVTLRGHPEALRPFLPEIREFARFNHLNVLHPILRLIAMSLELPEDTLVNIHNFDGIGETYVRFMKYYPRSAEEEAKTKNVWLKGHTDFGSITILWSQPVAALQILIKDGGWRWVRHIDNALVVNAGDALDFLTGGYYKGTIHRVVQPPQDQQKYTRLGVFYFVMPDDHVRLEPLQESPVLHATGIYHGRQDSAVPTMEEWRKARTAAYGQTELKVSRERGVEEEVINGVLVKYYN